MTTTAIHRVPRGIQRTIGACALGILSAIAATAAAGETEKPNIVMVIVDDFGRQDVGAYGGDFYDTPAIDRLAEEGMRFDQAYVAHARCLPSRLAFMSGRYPVRYGIPGFQDESKGPHALPLSTRTFGEVLKDAGYATAFIGKWHLGKMGGEPLYQGFDTSIMAGKSGAPPSYFWPYQDRRDGEGGKGFESYTGGEPGEYLTDRLTDEALGFIDDHRDEPFLLVLAHYAVHTPFEAPEPLVDKYREKIERDGVTPGGPDFAADAVVDRTGQVKTVQNNPIYAGMIESVDQNMARLLDHLDERGLADNTVIILTSDHGGLSTRGLESRRKLATSNLPFRHGKGWLYEGGIRVPLIVRWPARIEAGSVSQVQVTGTDHYPTILQAAGLPLEPENHKDGESYLPALDGKDYTRPAMFWHSSLGRPEQTGDTRSSAMIDGRWKLIQWYSLEDESIVRVELFDLAADPYEKNDLLGQEPERAEAMEQRLDEWKASVNARLGQFRKGGV